MQDSFTNIFLPNKGTLLIAGLPAAESNVVSFIVPGKRIGYTTQPTALLELKHPQSQGEFSTFSVSFNIDKRMKNYLAISEWLDSLMQYQSRDMYPTEPSDVQREVTILLYDNDNSNMGKVTIQNAFPTSISEFEINFSEMSSEPRVQTVEFEYDTFSIEIY